MKSIIRWVLVPIIPLVAVAAVELIAFVARVVYGLVTAVDISAPHGFHERRDGLMMLLAMVMEGAVFVWAAHEAAPNFKKAVSVMFALVALSLTGLFAWLAVGENVSKMTIAWCVVPFLAGAAGALFLILKKNDIDN